MNYFKIISVRRLTARALSRESGIIGLVELTPLMDNLDASIPFSTNHAFTVEARSNESFSLNAVGPESSVWPIIVEVNAVLFASNDWSEVSSGK